MAIQEKDFFKNVVMGILIRFVSFIFPYLFITPYLIRTLGEGLLGLTSFSIGFVSLFYPFVEYGFMLTAPRNIMMHLTDKVALGRILSKVLLAKLFLCILSSSLVVLLIFSIPTLKKYSELHLLSLSLLIGQSLSPIWLYQGLNKLKIYTLYNLIINIFILINILVFVRQSSDYLWVTLIQGCCWIVGYSFILWRGILEYLPYMILDLSDVWSELKKGFFIFITNLLHFAFLTVNIVILGFYVSGKPLDDYSYAERIYMIFRTALGIIYQMAYPKVFMMQKESERTADKFLFKLFVILFVGMGVGSLTLYALSGRLILLFTGSLNPEATAILDILTIPLFIYSLSIPFSQKILSAYSAKHFSYLLGLVLLFNVILNNQLTPLHQGKGVALTMLWTESFFLALSVLYVFFQKRKKPIKI